MTIYAETMKNIARREKAKCTVNATATNQMIALLQIQIYYLIKFKENRKWTTNFYQEKKYYKE